jgi:hypothetical protein
MVRHETFGLERRRQVHDCRAIIDIALDARQRVYIAGALCPSCSLPGKKLRIHAISERSTREVSKGRAPIWSSACTLPPSLPTIGHKTMPMPLNYPDQR